MKYTDELTARAVAIVIHAQTDSGTANGTTTRFLRSGTHPPIEVIRPFIDNHHHEFGVGPTVHAPSGTAVRIAVSSYYAFKKPQPSARARQDQALMVITRDAPEGNYSCCGARKI